MTNVNRYVGNGYTILENIVKKPRDYKFKSDKNVSTNTHSSACVSKSYMFDGINNKRDYDALKEHFRVQLGNKFKNFIFLDRPKNFNYKFEGNDNKFGENGYHSVVITLDCKESKSYMMLRYVFRDNEDLKNIFDNESLDYE